MTDYSMYKFFKGETKNPFSEGDHQNAGMWWMYEQDFENRFNEYDTSDWFQHFNHGGDWSKRFMSLVTEEDHDIPTASMKAPLFSLWLEFLTSEKMTEYGENWGLQNYKDTSLYSH